MLTSATFSDMENDECLDNNDGCWQGTVECKSMGPSSLSTWLDGDLCTDERPTATNPCKTGEREGKEEEDGGNLI